MKQARALQICGTGSGVGKSVIVAGLCRVFLQDGYRVCPFKAQNMALNSFVTKEEGEIGRAQAVQAAACGIEPTVDMNPILIKPTSDIGSQIIVRGVPTQNMKAAEYAKHKKTLKGVVRRSFASLRRSYDIVVIEGAGSPAEINLKRDDLVNMKMARHAGAPVILVGDIDKGGVFAWLVGTMELLTKEERKMVRGIIINKFRGDRSLLSPGIRFLERRLGIKCLGVIPYFKDIKIPEEDSVALETTDRSGAKRSLPVGDRPKTRDQRPTTENQEPKTENLKITVVKLPHISNFTDFDALKIERDVALRYATSPDELDDQDLVIIPGTKNTIGDLRYLRESGLAGKIQQLTRAKQSEASPEGTNNYQLITILGICGGYQMLGLSISDRYNLESSEKKVEGLGLLQIRTRLAKEKVLAQVKAVEMSSGRKIFGYEIHHGVSECKGDDGPFFEVLERNGKSAGYPDGLCRKDGRVFGTYIHGLFDADDFRRGFLNRIRQAKGWQPLPEGVRLDADAEFDKLAKLLRENIDMKAVYEIINAA